MQISKQTLDILKNFSEINSSILIKSGSVLETISEMKNILAIANVTEDFSSEFGICLISSCNSIVKVYCPIFLSNSFFCSTIIISPSLMTPTLSAIASASSI